LKKESLLGRIFLGLFGILRGGALSIKKLRIFPESFEFSFSHMNDENSELFITFWVK